MIPKEIKNFVVISSFAFDEFIDNHIESACTQRGDQKYQKSLKEPQKHHLCYQHNRGNSLLFACKYLSAGSSKNYFLNKVFSHFFIVLHFSLNQRSKWIQEQLIQHRNILISFNHFQELEMVNQSIQLRQFKQEQ